MKDITITKEDIFQPIVVSFTIQTERELNEFLKLIEDSEYLQELEVAVHQRLFSNKKPVKP